MQFALAPRLARITFACAVVMIGAEARASLLDQLVTGPCVIGWEEPLIPAADAASMMRFQVPMTVAAMMRATATRLRESGIAVLLARSDEEVIRLAAQRSCPWLLTLTASGRGGTANLTVVVTLRQLPPSSEFHEGKDVRLGPPLFALARRHDPLPLMLNLEEEGKGFADALIEAARAKRVPRREP